MTGIDIPVIELGTAIHQPTILEISHVGELEYFQAIQIMCFDKKILLADETKGTSNLLNKNNFEIFMTLINGPEAQKQQNWILSTFALLLPQYEVQFLPRGLYCNNKTTGHNFVLDERNFDVFREIVNNIAGLKREGSSTNGSYNPVGPKAAAIAAKLMKGRQRIATQSGSDSSHGVLSRYVSILTVGLESMSLRDCLNLTVFQLYDLIERYRLYMGWDLDIRSRLAGGKPEEKPDDWMKDIH